MRSASQLLKPEAAYFAAIDGLRCALSFFDMKNASDVARIAELLFVGLNAAVEFTSAMNADELKTGREPAGKS